MSGYNTGGVNFDAQFDPDVVGDGPQAATYEVNGVPVKYADIKYGSKGPDCHYAENGVDLSNKWAKKGSAVYSLPINGTTYSNQWNIQPGTQGRVTIGLQLTGSAGAYTLQVYGNAVTGTKIIASCALPASATGIKYAFGAFTVPAGEGNAGGAITNNAPANTALSSAPRAYYQSGLWGDNSGTRARNYPVTITLYNASGAVISTTNINLVGTTEGSV